MKKLCLALWLALAGPALAQSPVVPPTTQQTSVIVGTVATSQVVAGIVGAWTYITTWATTPTSGSIVKWIAGTGTACASNQITLTASLVFAGTVPAVFGNGSAPIMVVPQSLSVCMTIATQVAPGWFGFAQF